jgi:hypothetical protein
MENNFEQFLQEYSQNLDNGEWLSSGIIHLAAILYELNKKISQAELDEYRITVNYLDQIRDGKKMAVSEAEKRALVDTNNTRHLLENSNEAIQEMIQAIKKRLDVLAWDYKNQGRIK